MPKKLKTSLFLAALLPALVLPALAAPVHPMLKFSMVIGGTTLALNGQASSVATDEKGNIYVGGYTTNYLFAQPSPATPLPNGLGFVSSYDRAGKLRYTTLLYSGGGNTAVNALAVDARGIYVTGNTRIQPVPGTNIESDFSVWSQDPNNSAAVIEQAGAIKLNSNMSANNHHAFFVRLNPANGTSIVATVFGGDGTQQNSDIAVGIAVDKTAGKNPNVLITGYTCSPDFQMVQPDNSSPRVHPASDTFAGPPDDVNGYGDAFVTKIKADPKNPVFIYYRFIGGSGREDITTIGNGGIAVDNDGNAFVTGTTASDDFFLRYQPSHPQLQASAFQGQKSGGADAFLVKIKPNGEPAYATYLGGEGDDYGIGVAVDDGGRAYVVGSTGSSGFNNIPATQLSDHPFNGGAFVAKVNPAGKKLDYLTLFGGEANGAAITVDDGGRAFVTGDAKDLLTTNNSCIQLSLAGDGGLPDAFIAGLAKGGDKFIYASYLGGSLLDIGLGIALDPEGNVIIAGATESTNFPQYPLTSLLFGNNLDTYAFLAKIRPH